MSITLADRVRETTETAGAGTVDLAGAEVGFQGFVAGAGDGAVVYYCIVGQSGGSAEGEWETGIGTVTDAAPDTLSRDTVLGSSNGGAAVNFSAGTKDVFLTVPAAAPVIGMEVYEPSGVATLDIPTGGYEAVKIVGWLRPATDASQTSLRFSNDGGASFRAGAADYAWVRSDMSTSGAPGDAADAADSQMILSGNIGDAEYVSFDIMVLNQNTNGVYTSIVAQLQWWSPGDTFPTGFAGGSVLTAEINNAVRMLFSAGNIAAGRVVVYGYPAP